LALFPKEPCSIVGGVQSGDDFEASFCEWLLANMHFCLVLGVDVIQGGGGGGGGVPHFDPFFF